MPRRSQRETADVILHVWNRGARRLRLFRDSVDYTEFLNTMHQAQQRVSLRLLAYALMPTHFHFVLWPRTDGQLRDFMGWMTTAHSKRWHARHQTSGTGPVYQGPYKASAITSPRHFLNVCRYVEANALEKKLVARAEEWPWSSLGQRCRNLNTVALESWPILQPTNWLVLVNERGDRRQEGSSEFGGGFPTPGVD
jgi:putative transposase